MQPGLNARLLSLYRANYERYNYVGLSRLQAAELHHNEE